MQDRIVPIRSDQLEMLMVFLQKIYKDVPEYVFVNVIPAHIKVWQAVCYHGASLPLPPREEGDLPLAWAPILTLESRIDITDGSFTISVLAGQCKECGRVHWALSSPQPAYSRKHKAEV